jgi:hypothetical protein
MLCVPCAQGMVRMHCHCIMLRPYVRTIMPLSHCRGCVGASCCYGFRLGHVGVPDRVYDNNKQRPCCPFVCGYRQGFTWYLGDSQGRLLPVLPLHMLT